VAANQVFASFKELLKIPEYWRERTIGFLNILKEQIAGFSTKIHDREKLITSQDPKRNLKLGYSILRAENGQLIRSKKEAPKGTKFKAETGDGGFLATAD
jgi:exonuclease VII large subunit